MRNALNISIVLFAALLCTSCMSPTDPDTPRLRITDPSRYFLRTFDFSADDTGFDIEQLDDGGYIIVGSAKMEDTGSMDVILVRTDNEGQQLWLKSYGGISDDGGYSVSPTQDGGFIITGYTESESSGKTDLWLIKTDENGAMQWSQSYGGEGADEGQEVCERRDGGYYIVGSTREYSDAPPRAWVIRTNELGGKIWKREFGTSERNHGTSFKETEDGGVLVAGYTDHDGDGRTAIWLFKLTAAGDSLEWEYFVNGNENASKGCYHLIIDDDGNRAIAGDLTTYSPREKSMLFVKMDETGDIITERILHENAIAKSIESTPDGGYIVCGYTNPYNFGQSDIVLVKLDINGNTLWKQVIGGSQADRAHCVTNTLDGGYILTGTSSSYGGKGMNLLLIKTNAAGSFEE